MSVLKILLVILLCVPIAFLAYTLLEGLLNETLMIRQRDKEARRALKRKR